MTEEIGNVADVSWRTVSGTPRAFYDEIAADLSQRPAQVVLRAAEGVVGGVVGTALLKNSKVAAVAGIGALVYTGYETAVGADHFLRSASRADTEAQRAALADRNARHLGAGLSTFVESAPGMLAGGYLGARTLGAPPLYTRVGDLLDKNLMAPARESLAFRGPGSLRLSSTFVKADGEFDAVASARLLAERHPWQGVETGATLDLDRMRLSRSVTGREDVIGSLPGVQRDNVVPFHTHGPEAPVGYRPSRLDLAATRDLGIVQQGARTTYYMGEARQYASLAQAGNAEHFAPLMRAVSVDHEKGLAERITGQWIAGRGWRMDPSEPLDFARTLEALGRVRPGSAWSTLTEIAAKTPNT
ncbi:MAG: hypothetical protein KGS72_28230 [Cyanobacteria bacterium REEB67]|nr:hypothetical protein [Cyanobacteria bacterium REEB67]